MVQAGQAARTPVAMALAASTADNVPLNALGATTTISDRSRKDARRTS